MNDTPKPDRVYELVDATHDEYYTKGLFWSVSDAITEATKGDRPPTDDYEDFVRFEVRERKIGLTGHGRKVAEVKWHESYDAEADEYVWIAPTVTQYEICPPSPALVERQNELAVKPPQQRTAEEVQQQVREHLGESVVVTHYPTGCLGINYRGSEFWWWGFDLKECFRELEKIGVSPDMVVWQERYFDGDSGNPDNYKLRPWSLDTPTP